LLLVARWLLAPWPGCWRHGLVVGTTAHGLSALGTTTLVVGAAARLDQSALVVGATRGASTLGIAVAAVAAVVVVVVLH